MFTLLPSGICEDRRLMEEVFHHYRVGPVNSGITRYIYPMGNARNMPRPGARATRLGYLARTAMVAWNQGVDLFAEADNRLALGFEYTASLLLGETVHAYGKIVDNRGRFNDIYEGILQHYRSQKHMNLPQTERRAARSRSLAQCAHLLQRNPRRCKLKAAPEPSKIAATAGARQMTTYPAPAGAIAVAAGESFKTRSTNSRRAAEAR